MAMEFTDQEVIALKVMMLQLAKWCREDISGTILYTGAFRAFGEEAGAVVRLARKLEFSEEEKKEWENK